MRSLPETKNQQKKINKLTSKRKLVKNFIYKIMRAKPKIICFDFKI